MAGPKFRCVVDFCGLGRNDSVDQFGMCRAFLPGSLHILVQLPVVEARSEAAGNRLVFLGAVIMAEAVISEPERLGDHPAFAVIP